MSLSLQRFCLALCLCSAAAAASAAPFVSPRGYSLSVPPGWQVEAVPPGTTDLLIRDTRSRPKQGTPNFRVDVARLGGSATLETLKPVVAADYARKFPGIIVKSQAFSSLGGVRDLDLVFTKPQSPLPLRLHQIYVLKAGLAYIFTAAYPEKARAKYDPMIAQILASVRWKS